MTTEIDIDKDEILELCHRVSKNETELNDILTIDDGETNIEELDLQLVEKLEWKPEKEGEFTFEIEGNNYTVEIENTILDSGIYIQDNFEDDKLTDREESFTRNNFVDDKGNEIENAKFRPEWSIVSGSPSVSDGILTLSDEDDIININSELKWGAWRFDFRFVSLSNDTDGITFKFVVDGSDEALFQANQDDNARFSVDVDFNDNERIIDPRWEPDTNWHTVKIERRPENGNDEWALYLDDMDNPKGTEITDSRLTIDTLEIEGDRDGSDVEIRNLRVGLIDKVDNI